MRSSTFKWGYCVLPDSLVPVSQKKELVDSKQTQDVQKNSPLLTHTHWCALTIYIWSVFYEGTRPWLTWLHVCCQLPCDRHSAHLFSSSTWWTRSSCHTAAPGLAGSPGNPLKQRKNAVWTDEQRRTGRMWICFSYLWLCRWFVWNSDPLWEASLLRCPYHSPKKKRRGGKRCPHVLDGHPPGLHAHPGPPVNKCTTHVITMPDFQFFFLLSLQKKKVYQRQCYLKELKGEL